MLELLTKLMGFGTNQIIEMTKRKFSWKKEIRDWAIFGGVIAFLYFTGLHQPLIAGFQQLVLMTGIHQPDKVEEGLQTDYQMQLTSLDGKKMLRLSELKGKVVFINFWATWCPPCIAEMPDIENLYQDVKDEDIVFLMISLDEIPEKARTFIEKKEFTFPVYFLASSTPPEFESSAIPTTIVLSPQGEIVVHQEGMAQYNSKQFKEFLLGLREK